MKIVTGDLIKMAKNNEFDVIVHGCNCFTTMGGGIAKSIKAAFPEAWGVDRVTEVGDPRKLGTITFAPIPSTGLVVVNAYTQFKYWKDKKDDPTKPLIDYLAVEDAFKDIKKLFGGRNLRFGIPKIGAGLALGDWDKISQIIEKEMEDEDLTLVEFVK